MNPFGRKVMKKSPIIQIVLVFLQANSDEKEKSITRRT
jgi:hypothetical protein